MTSGKIIVCLTGLALLIRLCPRDVKIFPNWVLFTAVLGRDFKNTPIVAESHVGGGVTGNGVSAHKR